MSTIKTYTPEEQEVLELSSMEVLIIEDENQIQKQLDIKEQHVLNAARILWENNIKTDRFTSRAELVKFQLDNYPKEGDPKAIVINKSGENLLFL